MSAEYTVREVIGLKAQPAQRAVTLGQYIIENKATVRSAAKKFGISKSTVHTVIQKGNGIWIWFKCRFFAVGIDSRNMICYNYGVS